MILPDFQRLGGRGGGKNRKKPERSGKIRKKAEKRDGGN
jgi:hypothetical protein